MLDWSMHASCDYMYASLCYALTTGTILEKFRNSAKLDQQQFSMLKVSNRGGPSQIVFF